MAHVRGSLARVLLKYPDLQLDKVRLIGWGAGQVFRDYYPLVDTPVEYTVCPDTGHLGRTVCGVPVKSPEELMKEPQGEILLLIFATHAPEIMQQIRKYWGDYRNVRAVDFSDNSAVLRELGDLQAIVGHGGGFLKPPGMQPGKLGIFLQGPVLQQTPLVLAHTRTKYPGARLLFVTWKTESAENIARCRPWVDDILQLDMPEFVSWDTRNYIISACKAGSAFMAETGVDYVVRSRSDVILTGSVYDCIDRLFEDGQKNKGKTAIHIGTTWAYMPFHFSDKILISRPQDMVDLWSVPLDLRPLSYDRKEEARRHFLEMRHITYENYVWTHYAASLGYAADTLEDSYRFARDRLVPLDKDVSLFGLKHFPLFDVKLNRMFAPSLDWWNEMHRDFEGTLERLSEITASDMTISDFFQNRLG